MSLVMLGGILDTVLVALYKSPRRACSARVTRTVPSERRLFTQFFTEPR